MTEPIVPTTLQVEPWRARRKRWPKRGRHVLAQYDDRTIVVYQAYNSSIAEYAAKHRRLWWARSASASGA